MSNEIFVRAHAKINLALAITGKRADGYHEIDAIMQSVGLSDLVHVKLVDKPNYLKAASDDRFLPSDERNIAYRAAKLMIERFGLGGVFVGIEKAIPIAAGLGGGSADAAAVICGLNELCGLGLTAGELCVIALELGADVPFCVTGGLQRAQGVGEILSPLPFAGPEYCVIVKPALSAGTADVFAAYREGACQNPDVGEIARKLSSGGLVKTEDALAETGNVLESVTAAFCPIIDELKAVLRERGAYAAHMTGSGTAVYGVFKRRSDAAAAADELKTRRRAEADAYKTAAPRKDGAGKHKEGGIKEIFMTRFCDKGLQFSREYDKIKHSGKIY